jgi:uncharacterized protein (TIRG00374 family)
MRQSQIVRGALFALAIGLVAAIIWYLGPRPILDNLSRIGGKIGFVFLLGFPRFFLNTLGWMLFLPKGSVPLKRLYLLKIAGELLTRVTPLHFLGGDTARVFLIGKAASRETVTASVLIDRTAVTLGGAFFILSGIILGSFLLPLSQGIKLILAALMGLIFLALAFLITQQKKGMLRSGLRLLKDIGLSRFFPENRLKRIEEKIAPVDETLRSHYDEGHGKLFLATLLNYLSRWAAAGEIYLLFLFLQIPLGPLHAVMFGSMSLLLTASIFILPGSFGVAEGAYGLFFHLLKLDPALGVSLELSRKINGLIWYAFGGLLALSFKKSKTSNT